MKLALKLAGMFFVEFYKVLKSEQRDSTLYPQEKYGNCLDRAMAMISDAIKRPAKYCACLIANHREELHGEIHTEETIKLEKSMPVKDVKATRKSRGFWQG